MALADLLAPVIVSPAAVLAQETPSTPEAEPAYYSDTEGPLQPGGVVGVLLL